jgi:hypothetical protein
VAVNRPADVLDAIGWQGAANYDGDPLDMSTVLRSWEVRFDAYLVGLTTDTLTLAVGRPPRDLASALAIAAEHYAFCSPRRPVCSFHRPDSPMRRDNAHGRSRQMEERRRCIRRA